MSELSVFRAPTIEAEIRVPGDKSMSHRAVLLSAISNGTCVVRGFLPSEDCQCTVNAMRNFGITIEQPEETTLIIHGQRGNLHPPFQAIDCGNSGTLMRLLCGLAATQPFESRLIGDGSLSLRPMPRDSATPDSLRASDRERPSQKRDFIRRAQSFWQDHSRGAVSNTRSY
jgi:3-phosphoshikimate 1-carboxyvinyltransferase